MRRFLLLGLFPALWLLVVHAQSSDPHAAHDMSGMPMSSADGAMSMHEMHSSGHMQMTALRPLQPGDQKRADQVAQAAKHAMAKYTDYKVAEADGFRPFHPEIKQQMVHFTNYQYALEARSGFNPEHPTSLLYEPVGNGYRLIGAMYTAPFSFTEDELNQRVPLSVAQWHLHTNLCMPPAARRDDLLQPHPKFGFNGSIATAEACSAAGGTFRPHVFGWMVHVYPNESDPSQIWSVERQMHDMN